MSYAIASSSATYLHVASGLTGGAFTLTAWVKLPGSYLSTGATTIRLTGTVGDYTSDTDEVGMEGPATFTGHWLRLGNVFFGPEPEMTEGGADYAGWQAMAIVSDGAGNIEGYTTLDGAITSLAHVVTATVTGVVTDLYLGSTPTIVASPNGKYYSVKFWRAALTSGEILSELGSPDPGRTTNLWTFLRCNAGSTIGQDQSGNGNDWTLTGTIGVDIVTDTDTPVFSNPFNVKVPMKFGNFID